MELTLQPQLSIRLLLYFFNTYDIFLCYLFNIVSSRERGSLGEMEEHEECGPLWVACG
jgi:hypothetical protein